MPASTAYLGRPPPLSPKAKLAPRQSVEVRQSGEKSGLASSIGDASPTLAAAFRHAIDNLKAVSGATGDAVDHGVAGQALSMALHAAIGAEANALDQDLRSVTIAVGGQTFEIEPAEAHEHPLTAMWVRDDFSDALAHLLWSGATCAMAASSSPRVEALTLDAIEGRLSYASVRFVFPSDAGPLAVSAVYGPEIAISALRTTLTLAGWAVVAAGAHSRAPSGPHPKPAAVPADEARVFH